MTPAHDLASGTSRAHQLAALASLGTLLGVLLSGPVSVALVSALHPQPPWRDAELSPAATTLFKCCRTPAGSSSWRPWSF